MFYPTIPILFVILSAAKNLPNDPSFVLPSSATKTADPPLAEGEEM